MKCPYCIKKCTGCKKLLIANNINFAKAKKGKWNLSSKCKKCVRKDYEKNIDDNKRKQKEYRENNKEEISNRKKICYQNKKEKYKEKSNNYRKENKEKYKIYGKEYRENNREKISNQKKQWYQENKEDVLNRIKEYNENNPHTSFNNRNKRRQLEEEQGGGITKEQWLEMMDFFNWQCAYSGEYLGGNSSQRTIDHIISLNKNGLNEIWNCVPMLKKYNSSKYTNDMVTWYKQQDFFDIDKLMKIYEWQEYAFEKWGENNG